jgi:transposase InsO family protein
MTSSQTPLTPKDHAEAIALFRSEIVGALVRRELDHGDLRSAFTELSQQRFRPPRAHGSRSYAPATLERWYYAYKSGGLDALRPKSRSDKGRGRELSSEQRALLLEIRREHPHASVPMILATLVADGRFESGAISASTVRRLYAEQGLDRVSLRHGSHDKVRLRWQAERPGALWHGDVCHARALKLAGAIVPVRIHALLDDASRFVIGIEARTAEREIDMLGLLVRALRRHGPPDALYLDNGATYRGQALSLACARMGIALLHARPYDAPARGKMERFWRTLREQCLDLSGSLATLHDLNVRLYAWVDEHYHRTPHGGLLGRTPDVVYDNEPRVTDTIDEVRLRDALTVRARRRVRRDNTLSMDGVDWQTDLHFLAGRLVTVARCLALPDDPPWLEHEGKRFELSAVDPVRNARRERSKTNLDTPHPARVPFDPPSAMLRRALGKTDETDSERDEGGVS